jgi:hypothetical protein
MRDALKELPLQIRRHDAGLKCTRDVHLPTDAISGEVPHKQNVSQSPDDTRRMSAVFHLRGDHPLNFRQPFSVLLSLGDRFLRIYEVSAALL